ncbi:hypothetical protein DICPUDRAFT_160105, partial [Dictyostelium purpureum]
MSINLELNNIWKDFLFSWEKSSSEMNGEVFPSEVFLNIFGNQKKIELAKQLLPPYNLTTLYHGVPNTCSDLSCNSCGGCNIMKNGFNLSLESSSKESYLRFRKG